MIHARLRVSGNLDNLSVNISCVKNFIRKISPRHCAVEFKGQFLLIYEAIDNLEVELVNKAISSLPQIKDLL